MPMEKLGFTFYPQDWWSSDSFYDFDPFERYVYLECLFIMYRNNGYMKTQKTQFENRVRISVSDEVWSKITSKFINTDEGFTSLTVNKRLKKAAISKQNGLLGGRPRKQETQKTQPENLKRKRIEREGELGRDIITHGKGKLYITVRRVFANDPVHKIFDLSEYFKHTQQLETMNEKGWVYFAEFINTNAGKIFNEPDHLYNSFKNFCITYRPAPVVEKFKEEAFNKSLWTLEAWEQQYDWQLKSNNEFRKHFGYAEL